MSQISGKKAYYIANPVTGWAQMPYNTKEVLTESGEWESPITGFVKVTCIGGGAAGASMATSNGSNMYSIRENPGGNTSFGDVVALGGFSPGGEAVLALGSPCGGYAGEVKTEYLRVDRGDIISVSIGAGGSATGAFKPVSNDCYKKYPCGAWGSLISFASSSTRIMAGSTGGSNGTSYGGGGGSASGAVGMAGSYPGTGSGGGADGAGGQLTTSHSVNLGGTGGAGAVILEYADPQKKA